MSTVRRLPCIPSGGGSGAGLSIVGVGDLLWIQSNSATYFESSIAVDGTLQVDGILAVY